LTDISLTTDFIFHRFHRGDIVRNRRHWCQWQWFSCGTLQ